LAPDTDGIPDMVIRIHRHARKTPTVVVALSCHKNFYEEPMVLLGKRPKTVFRRFYSSIRKAEKLAQQLSPDAVIIMEDLPRNDIYETLHDRIQKATQGRTI